MQDLDQSRTVSLIGLGLTGVVLGAALGAVTNAVNGWVSPLYFRNTCPQLYERVNLPVAISTPKPDCCPTITSSPWASTML